MGRVNNSGAGTDGRRKASAGKKKVSKAKLVVDRAPKSVVRRSTRNGNGRAARGRPLRVKPTPVRKVARRPVEGESLVDGRGPGVGDMCGDYGRS